MLCVHVCACLSCMYSIVKGWRFLWTRTPTYTWVWYLSRCSNPRPGSGLLPKRSLPVQLGRPGNTVTDRETWRGVTKTHTDPHIAGHACLYGARIYFWVCCCQSQVCTRRDRDDQTSSFHNLKTSLCLVSIQVLEQENTHQTLIRKRKLFAPCMYLSGHIKPQCSLCLRS